MISNHDTVNKLQAALYHLKIAMNNVTAYADTPLGSDIINDLKAVKSNLLSIGDGVKPEDLLDKT